jgi:hypothetical protein
MLFADVRVDSLPSNAPCNPEILLIDNVGICVSLQVEGTDVLPDQATASAVPAVVGFQLVLICIKLLRFSN